MTGTKAIKRRIKATRNIAKVTKAMQMVAATKMGRAQRAALSSRSYAERLATVAAHLAKNKTAANHPFLAAKGKPTVGDLIIVVAPEKGLCGSLATNLEPILNIHRGSFISVGNKARGIILKNRLNLIADFPLGLRLPGFELVQPLAHLVTQGFIKEDFGRVYVIYSHFENTVAQTPTEKTLLPLRLSTAEPTAETYRDYLFEPDAQTLMDSVFKHYLEMQLFQVLLESYASEQSARMIAMKNATDNASSGIDELTLFYNKSRQQEITSEIADIVKGSSQ